ncbi:MAG: helix-turn-helix domain-containing protein [Gemmatimonadales bacterium]
MGESRRLRHQSSTGNVFRDLGFKNPDAELAKAQLVLEIVRLLRRRSLTQTAAARLLGLPQPKVSQLSNGDVTGFSTDRLIRLLNRLDQDVAITVTPKPHRQRRARVRVVAGRPHGS